MAARLTPDALRTAVLSAVASALESPPSIFLRGIISSIQDPIRVSTPKTTLSSGSKRHVTAITRAPAPKTSSPRLRSLDEKGMQKPDSIIKVQQMLCCHIYAARLPYQGQFAPNKYTASQHAWYKIILMSVSPLRLSKSARRSLPLFFFSIVLSP